MTNFEMVERLRMKANVSYEEAKAALEACNWDLLDAMVLLERQGKVRGQEQASYSTREEPAAQEAKGKDFKGLLVKLGKKLLSLIEYLCRNGFEISFKGKAVLTLPVLVLVLCLICLFPLTLIALIVGLFFGLRYAFRGPELDKGPLNSAMDKAADMAESIKQDVQSRKNDPQD